MFLAPSNSNAATREQTPMRIPLSSSAHALRTRATRPKRLQGIKERMTAPFAIARVRQVSYLPRNRYRRQARISSMGKRRTRRLAAGHSDGSTAPQSRASDAFGAIKARGQARDRTFLSEQLIEKHYRLRD